jgi:hypothetical protein
MKKVIILLIVITVSFVGFAQKGTLNSKNKTEQLAKDEIYTCKMHQDVISENPGKCPVCGMTLIKQKITEQQKKMRKEGAYIKPKK